MLNNILITAITLVLHTSAFAGMSLKFEDFELFDRTTNDSLGYGTFEVEFDLSFAEIHDYFVANSNTAYFPTGNVKIALTLQGESVTTTEIADQYYIYDYGDYYGIVAFPLVPEPPTVALNVQKNGILKSSGFQASLGKYTTGDTPRSGKLYFDNGDSAPLPVSAGAIIAALFATTWLRRRK